MILHNLFFLVLAAAVYAALDPAPQASAKVAIALAGVYAAAVMALEAWIMPQYVYRPLGLQLEADEAAQRGDERNELIDERLIPGDELGQIMRTRNAAISALRRHERDLALALARLEEKNRMLETARQNLANQDRLASLGLMSASVAHEINTPLAVLHGTLEKLQETLPGPAAQERLARALRVSSRLLKISASLLDFARAPGQDMGMVPLRAVVEEAWELLAIEGKADSVRFANSVEAEHGTFGNADRLLQVFVNLLRNALYAVGANGSIWVRSRRFQEGELDWVSIAVEDDGPGIPPEILPQVFEAFVTTRLDARGTGLGLTVAEGIVRQHGGNIRAGNRADGGACLEVRLPAAPQGGQHG